MISIVDVTNILSLFFTFNTTSDTSSIEYEHSEYSDDYFRWTKDSFRHNERLTVIYNEVAIKIFSTEKVKDRLKGNMDRVSSDKGKVNFGCVLDIVADLVTVIPIKKVSDEKIKEYVESDKKAKEIKKDE